MAQQFGNFGGQTGLSMNNIMAAIERRRGGGATPALDQTTSGASNFQGLTGSTQPQLQSAPVNMNQLPSPQQGNNNDERGIILKALTQRLGTLSKIDTAGM